MKKTRFVIFGQGRSGSTLLGQLLNSHPRINCENELFNLKDPFVKNRLMMGYLKKTPSLLITYRLLKSTGNIYGFKLLWYQLENMENYLQRLQKGGWKIVHIDRTNLFDQTLSLLVARKSGLWHNYGGNISDNGKLRIDVYEMKEMFNIIRRAKAEVDRMARSVNCLRINYERQLSDSSNWQQTCDAVFEYLDVNETEVDSRLKKTYSQPYHELVENYYELRSASLNNWDVEPDLYKHVSHSSIESVVRVRCYVAISTITFTHRTLIISLIVVFNNETLLVFNLSSAIHQRK